MRRFMFILLTLTLFTVSVLAQSNTGRLVGTVSGPDGVIPGATIVITDNQTNKERTITASGDGSFSVAQLEVGTYTVKITAPGFKTFTATDLKIDVGQEYSLPATLEVGGVNESVTVVAGADVINSANGEISNTVSSRQIKELPLNGRNPLNLITLQAGTASNGATNTTINGQRSSFTNITRDGLNIQDNFIRSNATDFAPERPSVDNTGEFTLTTQNAGADKGYGASQVELVTPRGQNPFHGTAFLFNRNSKFAANSFFRNLSGTPKPFLNRNQFGGTISGPIIRNKLFFFGYYEGLRLRTSSFQTRTILTPSARQGVFTYRDNAGATRTVNLFSLLPASAGITGIDPTINSRILANVPTAGNLTTVGDQLNTTGYGFNQLANTDRNAYTTRIDYELNAKNVINGVFTYTKENNLRPDVDSPNGFTQTPITVQPSNNKFLALAYRFTPTGALTNELRGGLFYSRPVFNRVPALPSFFIGVPLISSPEVNFEQQGRFTKYYNIQDNAEYTHGNHSFRFGGQGQFFKINPFGPGAFGSSTIPTFNLGTNTNTPTFAASQFPGGISSTQLATANSLLALLGGIVSNGNLTFNATSQSSGFVSGAPPKRNLNYANDSFYVADQWRVRPNLTLNLGLRYEIFTGLREPNGLAIEPVITDLNNPVASILNPNGTYNFVGTNVGNKQFFKTDKNNFAPIFSFAYSPGFKNRMLSSVFGGEGTVIRGGFRLSYVNDEFVRAADNALIGNAGLSQTVNAVTSTGSVNLNARLNALPTFTAPTFQVPRTFAQNNALAGNFGTVFAINPHLQAPRTTEYNFGIQRSIGFKSALEIRYVGGKSDNLARARDFNQVNILSNGFLADFNRARQNLLLTGNPACTTAGCQTLTVFPQIEAGGLLGNNTIRNLIRAGQPGQLAFTYISSQFGGSSQLFLANPNSGVVDYLSNDGKYRYNSLQVEVRRRFSEGLLFQANYTFQKTLTNAPGVGQTRFDPLLNNAQPELEYARADYDQTHVFNFNSVYELPFGKGKRFLNSGGIADRIFGDFRISSIVRLGTGAPVTIIDPSGTLNRAGRSGRQTAVSSLTKQQIKELFHIRKMPNGVFFITDPTIINSTGRAAEGFGTTPFNGQVFFNAAPGQTGNLERAFINGPKIFTIDASIAKKIPLDFIKEGMSFQIQADAFNLLNRANFFVGQFSTLNINSTTFGKVTSLTTDPRIIQLSGRFSF